MPGTVLHWRGARPLQWVSPMAETLGGRVRKAAGKQVTSGGSCGPLLGGKGQGGHSSERERPYTRQTGAERTRAILGKGRWQGRGGGRGRGGKVYRASEEGLVCHSENCELSPAGPGQLAEDFKRREVSKAVF